MMNRRDVLRALGMLAAVPFVPRSAEAAEALGASLHRQLTSQGQGTFRTLDAGQQALVSQLCDRILPATDTPGALDVRVPEFIDLLLTERFDDAERARFLSGLADIDARARTASGGPFVDMAEDARLELMRTLDHERDAREGAGHSFGSIKSLTIYGYFTSERVTKEVLKTRLYFPKFDGCAPASA
jgi:gluconate 2-dehydrogenase gamma chain